MGDIPYKELSRIQETMERLSVLIRAADLFYLENLYKEMRKVELNLEAKNKEQEKILAYLQANASEALADKISNGVYIEKDDKRLLNKKTLDGFMTYANGEAQKLATKGARGICIDDDTVYGWAVHYFEEDEIEGVLYNEDGTEYKNVKPAAKIQKTQIIQPKTKDKPSNTQCSLFDLMDEPKQEEDAKEDTDDDLDYGGTYDVYDEDERDESPQEEEADEPQKQALPFYQKYFETQRKYPDDIILIRLGDFYEAFGKHAEKLAKLTGLTLTGRDCGLEERLPMVGFPYHAQDMYFRKITQVYSLRIIESDDSIRTIPKAGLQMGIVDSATGEIYDPQDGLVGELMTMFNGYLEVK